MAQMVFSVKGMSCDHCVKNIEKAVKTLDGVDDVRADLDTKKVTVKYSGDVNGEDIKKAINDAGYNVE
ncbi:heavy-metal-associated domain-containing protein [Mahella australiensis]|uniref:Copper ion binding protein n=1 Tax=Mahella australiensis (strain DSM 15567 / CIP 107919 / 50-1 BON) TaxID=697281 RepID=F3ZW72_MAHA5|nr:heavy metal-associated domain-containing protein [Mahella australiensis]AEE96452.1 copper ion binding protein [Mahella australiensis 50-1 BON]